MRCDDDAEEGERHGGVELWRGDRDKEWSAEVAAQANVEMER